MHVPGLLGMPRRIYTYPADRGWEIWNLVTTLGVPLQIAGVAIFVVNVVVSLRRGTPAGRRSLGRLDARVGHDLAAAALQLRGRAGGREPPAALGSQASRRPGRAARMSSARSTTAMAGPAVSHAWRGRAGMIGLIVAEASLFAVFVVAYLFYIGKSLNGPYPEGRARAAPLQHHLPARRAASRSRSASRALRRGRRRGARANGSS